MQLRYLNDSVVVTDGRPLPDGFTKFSTVALKEIGVRIPWRGMGVAKRMHDEFLVGRTEDRVTLLVSPLAGDGKVKAL